MLNAKVNTKYEFTLEDASENGMDLIEVKQDIFHILKNNKSYTAEVLKANPKDKFFVIRINGNKYSVQLKDKYDHLLNELGIENTSVSKVKELKAPMPGLVVDVRVKEGDTVKKGDALVVLQAMKMENVLKSPVDAIVKKIYICKEDTIEKNQLLINFL